MSINVRRLQQRLGAFMDKTLSRDQFVKGVEEGWVTPPQKVGRLGTPLCQKTESRSIDVLTEDRGE
jgi:hypothetical protein